MTLDRLQLIGGSDFIVDGICTVRQPNLGDIRDLGYDKYLSLLATLTAEKETIINALGVKMSKDDIQKINVFTLLLLTMPQELIDALSFFLREKVTIIPDALCVGVYRDEQDRPFSIITEDNYNKVRDVILEINFIPIEREENLKFKSEAARKRWERLEQHRKQTKKNEKADKNQNLPNLIGAIAARSYSYDLTNIWKLTIYQLYDQFSRIHNNTVMDVVGTAVALFGSDGFDEKFWYTDYTK